MSPRSPAPTRWAGRQLPVRLDAERQLLPAQRRQQALTPEPIAPNDDDLARVQAALDAQGNRR